MSMFKFKTVSMITAVVALVLCVILLSVPEVIFELFNVDDNSLAFFFGRRAAMLFLGISVLTWVGRNASHSESRQAICLGLATSMLALAILGFFEYLRGFAGVGILLAVITEVCLFVMYFKIWLSNKIVSKV